MLERRGVRIQFRKHRPGLPTPTDSFLSFYHGAHLVSPIIDNIRTSIRRYTYYAFAIGTSGVTGRSISPRAAENECRMVCNTWNYPGNGFVIGTLSRSRGVRTPAIILGICGIDAAVVKKPD